MTLIFSGKFQILPLVILQMGSTIGGLHMSHHQK